MNCAAPSPYRVESPGWSVASAPTAPPDDAKDKKTLKAQLRASTKSIYELQRRMYADNRHALLLVFQAMDAAGKDSTIRHVFSGVNPAGFQVSSFKRPSSAELDHDFLWRTAKALPQRGRIGIFNRSYYEEVLVVRVHPQILTGQRLPSLPDPAKLTDEFWAQRFESIRSHEQHLSRNGTTTLKFFLNVSQDAQKSRFMDRLDTPRKHWKFEPADVRERGHWADYMHAYQEAIRATSTQHAPWYAIPADNKRYMRATVADIVQRTLENMDPQYPEVSDADREEFSAARESLLNEA